VALAFALYANTLGHEFVFDDGRVITEKRYVQMGLAGIPQIFSTPRVSGQKGDSTVYDNTYRPLPLTTHAIEYGLFSMPCSVASSACSDSLRSA
jgi:hypothetical protein